VLYAVPSNVRLWGLMQGLFKVVVESSVTRAFLM
jgi:hypothetical protein